MKAESTIRRQLRLVAKIIEEYDQRTATPERTVLYRRAFGVRSDLRWVLGENDLFPRDRIACAS